MYAGGYTDYGIPMMTSPAAQLNLLQDVQSMAFDTVFMYNQGLITPEQLLDSIRRSTTEEVGQPEEFDTETWERNAMASGNSDLIDGMNQIKYNGMTAAGVAVWLRSKTADANYQEVPNWVEENIKDIEKQLEQYELLFRNRTLLDEKVASGQWSIDPITGAVMKELDRESARENLRADGWKGMFSDPEFWRTIPDAATMDVAARLTEQFAPVLEEQDALEERVGNKTMEEIGKTSSATKKLIEVKKEKGEDISQNIYTTTGGWKRIEDLYQQALLDFKLPRTTRAMGYEDLGVIKGIRYEIKIEDGKEKAYAYDSSGNLVRVESSPQRLKYLREESAKRKANPQDYVQRIDINRGPGLDMYVTYTPDGQGGHTSTLDLANGKRTVSSTPLVSSERPETSQEKASREYWARQSAYWTAKGEGERQKGVHQQAEEAKARVGEQTRLAMSRGTTPALQWLEKLPQIAALAAQPAPEIQKPKYVKPKPRVLSDQEIESMASMIAGGMQ